MFAYHIGPIDNGWGNLESVQAAVTRLKNDITKLRFGPPGPKGIDPDEFMESVELAESAAARVGWEGDYKQGPKVFWVPIDDAFTWGFVFKQGNNGSTFVISPIPMPHLTKI